MRESIAGSVLYSIVRVSLEPIALVVFYLYISFVYADL
jgi:hypothetical protein